MSVLAQGRPVDLYEGLAVRLVQEALVQQEAGDLITALFLLERARRVDPQLGDAVYHLAKLQSGGRDTRMYREKLLLQALQLPLDAIEYADVASAYAELLLETGRSAEAREFLAPLQRTDALDTLMLEASLASGPVWSTVDTLNRRRTADPLDTHLAALDFRRFPTVTISHLEWIQELLSHSDLEFSRYDVHEILRHVITMAPADARDLRAELTRIYFLEEGTSLEPVLLQAIDTGAVDNRLMEALTTDGKRLWELIGHRLGYQDWPNTATEIFQPALRQLEEGDHTIHRDDERNHSWDEYRFSDGDLMQWRHDTGRDGLVERVVQFNRTALTVRLRSGNDIFQLRYSRYPVLSEAHRYRVAMAGEEERIDQERSRTWRPIQPLPYEIGLSVVLDDSAVRFSDDPGRRFFQLVEILPGRVIFEDEMMNRFDRQFESAESRIPDEALTREIERDLRALEMLR